MLERLVAKVAVRFVTDDDSINRCLRCANKVVCDVCARNRCAYNDDFLVKVSE